MKKILLFLCSVFCIVLILKAESPAPPTTENYSIGFDTDTEKAGQAFSNKRLNENPAIILYLAEHHAPLLVMVNGKEQAYYIIGLRLRYQAEPLFERVYSWNNLVLRSATLPPKEFKIYGSEWKD